MSTLTDIRTKVRRITGRPSPQQITDAQIDEYINTFYQYDMPEELRLFTQKSTFEFMTEANVDTYDMNTMQVWTGADNQNAVDVFINVMPPAKIAGYQSFWSQDRQQFFNAYPMLSQISSSVDGDGTAGPYTVTFSDTPVLQNSVTVGAVDNTNAAFNCVDVPTNRTDGTWVQDNTNTVVTGSVNYITGVMSVTFGNAIPVGETVTFTAVPYAAGRPIAVLYYENTFTLRPVPDQSYKVVVDAYKKPTQLLLANESPQLKQWWQLIAYGASVKVFEDAQDFEGVTNTMPLLDKQLRLALRRTIVQRTNQRTATIYTENSNWPYGNYQSQF